MLKLLINGRKYSPKLILFDVDGTLIDDKHRYSSLGRARYNAFMELSSTKAAEDWARLTGVTPKNWSIDPNGPISKASRRDDLAIAAGALYLDNHKWYEARKLAEKIYNKADEEQRKNFKPRLYEGTENKLKDLIKAGYSLGLATNGLTRITVDLMEELGIRELFSVIIGADLVENSKPAPDMILFACEEAGHKAQDSIYVGDQATDMEAAKKAKISLSLGVRNPELHPLADEILDSISDIQLIE